jgi:hypothetical protein
MKNIINGCSVGLILIIGILITSCDQKAKSDSGNNAIVKKVDKNINHGQGNEEVVEKVAESINNYQGKDDFINKNLNKIWYLATPTDSGYINAVPCIMGMNGFLFELEDSKIILQFHHGQYREKFQINNIEKEQSKVRLRLEDSKNHKLTVSLNIDSIQSYIEINDLSPFLISDVKLDSAYYPQILNVRFVSEEIIKKYPKVYIYCPEEGEDIW